MASKFGAILKYSCNNKSNDMHSSLKKHPFGYWEVKNKPTQEELQKYYAEKYYQESLGSYESNYSKEELSYFNAKLSQRYAVLQRYLKKLDGQHRMLDVGCGEGYALAYFRAKGWFVRGMDFSSVGVTSKNPACIDALVTGDIFELLDTELKAGKKYEVVWLQNVLEHVIDPLVLLDSLRSLVAPGGLAVITVPNDCSITQLAALRANHIDNPFWVETPDHLTYFDSQSLANTANQTGWECKELLGDFPVDWFLFHPKSNYVRDKSAGKAAHLARVQIENFINERPVKDVIEFWSSAAKLGLGRDITAFLMPL